MNIVSCQLVYNHPFLYFLAVANLFIATFLYIKAADRCNIFDKPNGRSSHNYITVRGGGIVWWFAAVMCSLLYLPESVYFLIGITLISVVSFWDDVSSLPNTIRIIIHFLAITLLFYGLGLFRILPVGMIILAYVFFVGILNAYNFMDGINGITGLYSLAILIALQFVNLKIVAFTPPDFINFAAIACIVFLFFNYREKAKCFAGDVGSMAVSFWIVTLLLQLMLKTQSVIWIFFLTVYGVDSVCTLLHRLYLRQNIFEAHRMHFYQALTNERGISHLKVSAGYALAQFVICMIIIFLYRYSPTMAGIVGVVMLVLCVSGYLLKFIIQSTYK